VPRGRPKKQPDILEQKIDIGFAQEFARVLSNWFNPILSNQYLKNINMNPTSRSRDEVDKLIENPKENEQALRRVSEYLYNTIMPYKKLVNYYADIPTFDISIYPVNAKEKDVSSDNFKKDYDKVWAWLDKFNYKKEFKKVLLGMLLEESKFTYLRKSETGYTFQEMPTDYCIIDAWSELGYLYSFNLLYFHQTGVDINGFSPEFKKYYRNYLDVKNNKKYHPNIKPELRNGQWFYWQQIKPEEGWVFKFDNTNAGSIPPFIGLFLDLIELDTYKTLQQAKTKLEASKLIFGTIPRNKDNKSGNKADDFAIKADTLAQFITLVQNSLPEGAYFKALPVEDIKAIDFSTNEKNDFLSNAIKNLHRLAGTDQALFNAEKPNATTMAASTRVDSAFVDKVYEQFETFLNYHINKETKKFKFKVKLSGTIFNEDDRMDQQLRLAQSGIITPELPSALHLTEKEMRLGVALMQSMGYPDNLKPLLTSYTSSNKDGGRPKSKVTDLTPSGEDSRTNDIHVDE
jgi:hypothetical protein